MTPEEQQQVNAAFRAYEANVANMARECANMAMALEAVAIKLKASEEKVKELTPKPESNVVPITEPA